MRLLNRVKDVDTLLDAISKCKGDVILRSVDGREEFNMKSVLSRYIAIGKLCEEQGDQWEVFCMNVGDEPYMMNFFHEIKQAEA